MLTPISLEEAEDTAVMGNQYQGQDLRQLELEGPEEASPSFRSKWKLACCFSRITLQKLLAIFVSMVMVIVTANLTCYSHLKYIPRILQVPITDLPNNSVGNIVCKASYAVFVRKQNGSLDDLLTFGFVLPLVLISVLASTMFSPRDNNAEKYTTIDAKSAAKASEFAFTKLSGDPPLTMLTVFFVVLPSLYITFESQFYNKFQSWERTIDSIANPAGIAACFALSLFLIPVAKHSPLVRVFGLSFTQALFFHRIAGWISLVLSLVHGLVYFYMYGHRGGSYNNFFSNMITALYPPRTCWDWTIFNLEGQVNHDGCYGYWRNLTGTISLLAFVILGITSLEPVRRRIYSVFIYIHIPAAWFMMIGAIIHFKFIALFLMPNIIYYLATSAPEWIKHFVHARADKGPNIKSITWIADSNGCYQINLRCPSSQLLNDESTLTHGAFCKICVPQVSSIWHPFSVILGSQDDQAALLIRPAGPFTKDLCDRLFPDDFTKPASESSLLSQEIPTGRKLRVRTLRPPPTILVDGFYPAEYRWHERVLHYHDSVLLLAGGVGIVPFLSLLPCVMKELSEGTAPNNVRLRHLELHWYCREEGLAKFVCEQHRLHDLFDSTTVIGNQSMSDHINENSNQQSGEQNQIRMHCYIHVTSQQSGDNDTRVESNTFDYDLARNKFTVDVDTGVVDEKQSLTIDMETPRNTMISFTHKSGGRLWTDTLGSQKNTLFVFAIVLSMIVHWYYHSLSLFREIMPRTYPVLVILVIVLIIGMLQLSFERWSCKFVRNSILSRQFQFIPNMDDLNESNSNYNSPTLSAQPHVPDTSSQQKQNDQLSKSFTVSSGRPVLEDVVGPLINAEAPGAFFCGPKALRERVKKMITKKRRERHGIVSKDLPCAFYDEHSDI